MIVSTTRIMKTLKKLRYKKISLSTIASQKEDILWPYFVEPHSLRYDEYCEQGGDEEDNAYHDAFQLVVQ